MNIPAIVPSALCVAAGTLLIGHEFVVYFMDGSVPEAMPLAFGLYFIGKGLFIHSMLSMLSEFRKSR